MSIEWSHIECSHIECSHRVVTHRVLIYRVSIEWSHIECSHRVVTHTLHFVFIFTLFGVSCRDNCLVEDGNFHDVWSLEPMKTFQCIFHLSGDGTHSLRVDTVSLLNSAKRKIQFENLNFKFLWNEKSCHHIQYH